MGRHPAGVPFGNAKSRSLRIHSVPAVVIDGKVVSDSGGGVDEQALRAAGLGQPL
jgi:hypothetical protein